MTTLLGQCEAMQRLRTQVARMGPTPLPVVVTGETGTGKDLVAHALHETSGRSGHFVVVDCAAISAGVLQSELFGHVRGAFTGATHDRDGLIVAAHEGTLFLDEIGELPMQTQSQLLSVLQSKRVRPVGSNTDRTVDIRVVAATWRDLDALVAEGRFRRDLFHRLDVLSIHAPPLRDREGDVDFLFDHFLRAEATAQGRAPVPVTAALRRALRRWPWPGNVRELLNVARYLTAMTRGEADVADLPARLRGHVPRPGVAITAPTPRTDLPYLEARRAWLDTFQAAYVEAVLEEHGGNISAAARASGMDRRSIQRILRRAREQAVSHLASDNS